MDKMLIKKNDTCELKTIPPNLIKDFDNNLISMAKIGKLLSISRERVRQIMLRRHNRTAHTGMHFEKRITAKHARENDLLNAKQKNEDTYFLKRMGANKEAFLIRFGKDWHNKKNTYDNARKIARKRNITWKISYYDWLTLWQALTLSPYYNSDIRYCFVRINENKPFELGNVEFLTMSQIAIALRAKEALARKS